VEPRFRASPAPRYNTPTVQEPKPLRAMPNTLFISRGERKQLMLQELVQEETEPLEALPSECGFVV
jgi:hypothetical protein